MRQYRTEIHDEDQAEIYDDIEKHKEDLTQYRIDSKENVKIIRTRPKAAGRKAIVDDLNQPKRPNSTTSK
jgi:hypothetical protein